MELFRFGMFFATPLSVKALLLLLTSTSHVVLAQHYFEEHFGASVGVVFEVGTHSTGFGINANAYYTDHFFQFNTGTTLRFNEHSYGERRRYFETRSSLGVVFLFGKKDMPADFQLNGLNHQTPYNYGVAYNYVQYTDNTGTSQRSGGFGLHLKNFSVYHENDVFGGQAKDRFRTAHLLFTYRNADIKIGAGVNIWTGETANSVWQKIPMEKCPSGFRILEDLPYGKTSHGIAYGGLWLNGPYGQVPGLKLGFDSEQVRHFLQNRLIHDLLFLPEHIERNTPHYPRLDDHGCPVFSEKDIRRSKPFLQFGVNGNWSD